MGFGILFIGYIIMSVFSLNPFGDLAQLVGYSVILYALLKLSPYAKNFVYAKYTAFPLILYSAYASVLTVIDKLGFNTAGMDGAKIYLKPIVAIIVFAFHLFLLFGIRELAKLTELAKLSDKAVRNFIVGVFYFALSVFGMLNTPIKEDFTKYFGLPTLLIGLVWYILNIILIYSCYMWICLEGDEDMARKPSRFAFINRLNDSIDQKEKEAIQRTVEHARKKRRKKKK